MARLSYPALAFDNLTATIDLFRAGQVLEKRDLFANLVWNIQGPLQSLIFGDPDRKTLATADGEDADGQADLDERLDEFGKILDRAVPQLSAVAVANCTDADATAIDPATILAIVNVVLQLIDAWRRRRQNPQPAPQPIPKG
jgi:hypothetical protein